MRNTLPALLAPALALVAALAAGCGSSVTCGPDTREQNGQCVAATLSKCPEGQALAGSECKPVCGAGTVFKGGSCTIGDATCGAGTELVDNQCRMVDPLAHVTVHEADEPNDTAAKAARFTLPALGEKPAVLGGFVDVAHDSKADFDGFVFTATAGQRVRIVANAVGAPTVGVVLQPVDPNHPNELVRYVASLSERGAARELTLPLAGDWLLRVSETSNFDQLVSSVPRGGADFTYTVEVSTIEAPAAKALQVPGTANGSLVAGEVYDVPGNGESVSLVELSLATPDGQLPFNGLRMLWATDKDGHLLLDEHDTMGLGGTPKLMDNVRLVVPPGGAKLGVDYVVDLGNGGSYVLTSGEGSLEEVQLPFDGTRDLKEHGAKIFAFDVPANSVLNLKAGTFGDDVSFRMELRDSQFQLVDSDIGYYTASLDGFVVTAGRYFVVALDTNFRASDTDLDFHLTINGSDATPVGPVDVPGDGSGQAQAAGTSPTTFFAVYAKGDAALSLRVTGESGTRVQAKALSTKFETLSSMTSLGTDATIQDLYVKAGVPVLVQVNADHAGAVNIEVVTAVPNIVAEVEPNDTKAQAQVLAPDASSPTDVTAELSTATDDDYFTFTLADVADVTLTTRAGISGGAPDTYLVLYDASGTRVASNDDASGLFSQISKTALPAGQYFVEVSASPYIEYDEEGIGDYVLSVRLGTPVP